MATVADNIVATLKVSGVRRVYGLPGRLVETASLTRFAAPVALTGSTSDTSEQRHSPRVQRPRSPVSSRPAASCGPGNLHVLS